MRNAINQKLLIKKFINLIIIIINKSRINE